MNPLLVKFRNDRIFREGTFPEMRSEYVADIVPEPVARKTEFRVRENLVRTDTVSAVLSFPGRRVCALNFANANVPGGAYVLGGNAQEEALCRATLLYYTLRTARGFYRRNRLHVLPDYTHGMVYSENVPVVRDRDGALLGRPAVCDFITSPAVNRTFARFLFSRARLDRTMQERIDRIVALAARKRPDVLVLGAWGCGVFGNRRETVYPQFERAINRYLPDDVRVVFGDPRPAPGNGALSASEPETADSFPADEPLVAEEHGDVLWFDSARSAAKYVEAVDVRNAEYRFYDAKGFRLAAEVYGEPEAIRFVRTGVPAREELAGILSRYCESLHLHPASDSLEDLLVAAKTKAHTV